jgi:glutamate-5-semialdehyde dehydrogenase
MASLGERLAEARKAGHQLARAPERRKVAVAAFVDELAPADRPSLFPDARSVAAFEDPIGTITATRETAPGRQTVDAQVPAGLVLADAPAVDLIAAAIAAGDALALTGADDRLALARQALETAGLPVQALLALETGEGEETAAHADRVIGGPTPSRDRTGACHVFVDGAADVDEALAVCREALTGEPQAAQADTVLVHEALEGALLPALGEALTEAGIEPVAGEVARRRLSRARPAKRATWSGRSGSRAVGVRVVGSVTEALAHVHAHGSGRSEAIVTAEPSAAEPFLLGAEAEHAVLNGPTTLGAQPRPPRDTVEPDAVDVEALTATRSLHLPAPEEAPAATLAEQLDRALRPR